jgi:hypothetical protein
MIDMQYVCVCAIGPETVRARILQDIYQQAQRFKKSPELLELLQQQQQLAHTNNHNNHATNMQV